MSHFNSFCEPDDSTITISLTQSLKNPTQDFGEMIDTAYIVKLQTTENVEALVGFINEGIVTDKYIYIRDNYKLGSVIIFDTKGNYVKRLVTGRGHGEINVVSKIAFNNINNTLLVYYQNTVSQYTADGSFIVSYDVPLISDIVPISDGYLLVQRETQNQTKTNLVIKTDSTFAINDDCYVFMPEKIVKDFVANSYSYNYGNEPRLFWPLTNVIYSYKNNKVVAKYKLNYPHVTNAKTYEDYISKRTQGLYEFYNTFSETSNYIYLNFSNFERNGCDIYGNKWTNKYYSVKLPSYSIYSYGIFIGSCNDFFVRSITKLPYNIKQEIIANSTQWLSAQDIEKLKCHKEDEDNPLMVFYKLKNEQNVVSE